MGLNRLCAIEDWDDPSFTATVRRLLPYFVDSYPDFPRGREHRKHWEFAHLLLGLDRLGAIHDDAAILGVGAGHEETLYALSRWVRWVVATDVYGMGQFQALEGDAMMLVDPDHFARCAYDRTRLIVEYMDARDLRFPAGTFDAAFSSGSIEHVGGIEGAARSIAEMGRVVKPGGIVGITTECIVNGAPQHSEPGLELFTPATLAEIVQGLENLSLVEPLDTELTAATAALRPPTLAASLDADRAGREEWPHLLLEHEGRVFTSIAIFLRRHP
jgi:SAM-dependent methyltransferase